MSQGLGLGTSNPTEILHIFKEGDAAIRFQEQAVGTGTQTLGPNSPGTIANDAGIGSISWSNTGNAASSNGAYASAAAGTTQYLEASNFGFAIPGGATIEGIEVTVERKRTDQSVQILDAWYSETDNNGSFTFQASAGTNRVLIFVASQDNNNGSFRSLNSVTYGGQALTEIVSDQNSNNDDLTLEIWYLDEAGLASASGSTWAITWNGSIPDGELYAAATYQYVDQNALVNSSVINTSNNVGSLQLGSALAAGEGDLVVLAAAFGNDGRTLVSPAGYNTQVDIDVNSGPDHSLSVVDKSIVSDGSEQPTVSYTGGNEDMIIAGFLLESNDEVYDNEVKLVKGGVISGTNKADASDWSDTDLEVTYGSDSDLWGLTWSSADINSSNFGVAVSATSANGTASIDHVSVTVYYSTTAAAYTNWAMGIDESDADKFKIAGNSFLGTNDYLVVTTTGNVGIGTSIPAGKLDVYGSIYQSGGLLHADYVFQPEYKLESIEEHAEFMWQNKHLKAIPKAAVNARGDEVVDVGSHRRGIVEELEKAHIYIEHLNALLKDMQCEIEDIKQENSLLMTTLHQAKTAADTGREMQARIAALEALMKESAGSKAPRGNF